ncbi:hypothetical protein E2C01_024196 [Portunus trituberculatus]|uniref:Uncharacterized protein n=1 Tax=Portunus trituberculatus TaxID=210409 RepID=A0A5B7EDR6_PORTR|nr:hypothetical protein [Portunus trituberculatus]
MSKLRCVQEGQANVHPRHLNNTSAPPVHHKGHNASRRGPSKPNYRSRSLSPGHSGEPAACCRNSMRRTSSDPSPRRSLLLHKSSHAPPSLNTT